MLISYARKIVVRESKNYAACIGYTGFSYLGLWYFIW